MAGRGAVIVGGTRGIRLAVTQLLAKQGAGVVVNGRDADAARNAVQPPDVAKARAERKHVKIIRRFSPTHPTA